MLIFPISIDLKRCKISSAMSLFGKSSHLSSRPWHAMATGAHPITASGGLLVSQCTCTRRRVGSMGFSVYGGFKRKKQRVHGRWEALYFFWKLAILKEWMVFEHCWGFFVCLLLNFMSRSTDQRVFRRFALIFPRRFSALSCWRWWLT